MNQAWMLWFFLVQFLVACNFSPQYLDYRKARRAETRQEYSNALKLYRQVIRRDEKNELSLKAARRGSQLALMNVKDFVAALEMYQFLVLRSPDQNERVSAQKSIVQVLFYNIGNYDGSVAEVNKLLPVISTVAEKNKYRLILAKSYFYLNNFMQTEMEIDSILTEVGKDKDTWYDALLLQSSVYTATKKPDQAVQAIQKMIADYPERAKKENLKLNLAVSLEEKGDLSAAIQTLEGLRGEYPSPELIDLKIASLKRRKENQPGAKGLKR